MNQCGKFPTRTKSNHACQVRRSWIESKEFNNAAPMGFGRSVLVLLPFFDGRLGNPKSQQFGQLRHRKGDVNPLLAEVFSKGFRVGRVVP